MAASDRDEAYARQLQQQEQQAAMGYGRQYSATAAPGMASMLGALLLVLLMIS